MVATGVWRAPIYMSLIMNLRVASGLLCMKMLITISKNSWYFRILPASWTSNCWKWAKFSSYRVQKCSQIFSNQASCNLGLYAASPAAHDKTWLRSVNAQLGNRLAEQQFARNHSFNQLYSRTLNWKVGKTKMEKFCDSLIRHLNGLIEINKRARLNGKQRVGVVFVLELFSCPRPLLSNRKVESKVSEGPRDSPSWQTSSHCWASSGLDQGRSSFRSRRRLLERRNSWSRPWWRWELAIPACYLSTFVWFGFFALEGQLF